MAVDILCCCVCGTDVAGYIAFAAAEYIAVAAAADDAAGCVLLLLLMGVLLLLRGNFAAPGVRGGFWMIESNNHLFQT